MKPTGAPFEGDELTDDEARRVVTLAAQLYRQDNDRLSSAEAAAEVVDQPEYLARALAQIIGAGAARSARSASARNVGAAVIGIVLLAAVLYPVALYWRPAGRSAASFAPPPAVSPQHTEIGPLVVPTFAGLELRTVDRFAPTAITFRNDTDQAVEIRSVDEQGGLSPPLRVLPRATLSKTTQYSTPWYVSDQAGKPIGVYFATQTPSKAVIPADRPTTADQLPDGYLAPAMTGPRAPAPPAAAIAIAPMGFVNLSGRTVGLYCLDNMGGAAWVTTLRPGQNYFADTAAPGACWVFGDESGTPIASYVTPPQPGAEAVLLPTTGGSHQ